MNQNILHVILWQISDKGNNIHKNHHRLSVCNLVSFAGSNGLKIGGRFTDFRTEEKLMELIIPHDWHPLSVTANLKGQKRHQRTNPFPSFKSIKTETNTAMTGLPPL